ncbi:MAG: intradiol ring-cleavage dioxygenase [Anaerolineales bacterium]|nr:intradiol ring-cleavage dioxygenase [Anaerolineales bacterium]MCZ2123647.1 intradiol ring-cleavage dioxygenase [Anaerolineales bacterium]
MDNDDKLVGQILNRRDVLRILGLGSAATLLTSCAPEALETLAPTTVSITEAVTAELNATGTSIPMCVVRPEMTEGPYFVDEKLNRSDIREDTSDGAISAGAPLEVIFNVTQVGANGCTALPNAQVDIWHCDAYGVYSDVENAVGKNFLRGYQVTDANGAAKFATIYPGWYPGRAVHIHFKIRYENQEFTSQLFFDDAFTDDVYAQEPYLQKGLRNTLNVQDGIYGNGGNQLLLNVMPNASGYVASFDIGMQI